MTFCHDNEEALEFSRTAFDVKTTIVNLKLNTYRTTTQPHARHRTHDCDHFWLLKLLENGVQFEYFLYIRVEGASCKAAVITRG